jgi:hypothetical protein
MKSSVPFAVFTLFFLVAASGVMQAGAISGSLPFVDLGVSENGTNLANSTIELAASTETSGPGEGDFLVVPILTAFGPFTLDNLTIGTGGGFSVSNAVYGSFVASSGSIVTQTSSFLNVVLFGIYTPGPGFSGLTASPAKADISFDQTSSSVSGSFTLGTVPEPGALTLLGSGILVCWRGLRWQRKV